VYDRKTVRRRRAVLGLLVACSLILLTASFGDGLRSVERGALEVLGPIQEGASAVLKPFRDAAGWVGETLDAKGEVEDLRAERDRYRQLLVSQRDAARENAQLRQLLGMQRRLGLDDQRPVTARVISEPSNVWYATVQIDRGSSDGIREGQPVIAGGGLVGRTRTVSRGQAEVLLITDEDSGVAARVNESGQPGIVETAVGEPDDLRLEFLRRGARVREDQTIVTAGSRFPRGIPIGRVSRVDPEELDAYQRVHIRPFADLRRLEFVQVLTRPAV